MCEDPFDLFGGFLYLYLMECNYMGCMAEYLFATECLKKGFNVSMPLLDSSPYDCVIEVGGRLLKIQVKSTTKNLTTNKNSVHINLGNDKNLYTKENVDYFAIFSFLFNGFFIIKNTGCMKSIRLNINGKYSENFNNFDFD